MNTKIFLIIGLLFLSLQGIGQVNPTAAIKPANGENYILISRDTFGAARFIYDSVRFDISGDTLYFTDSVRVDLSSVVDTVLEIATKYDLLPFPTFQNQSKAGEFQSKIAKIKNGENVKAKIIIFGDSNTTPPERFTSLIKNHFWQKYDTTGTGWHSASDINFNPTGRWKTTTGTITDENLPTGSGLINDQSVMTSGAIIGFNGLSEVGGFTDSITVYYEKGTGDFSWSVNTGSYTSVENSTGTGLGIIAIETALSNNNINIRADETGFKLFGINTEVKNKGGVIIHKAGYGGYAVYDFADLVRKPIFKEIITSINPDLIIINLGSNGIGFDSFSGNNTTPEGTMLNMDTIISNLRLSDSCDIAIWSPSDQAKEQGAGTGHPIPISLYNDAYYKYAVKNELVFGSLYRYHGDGFLALENGILEDLVHYSANGAIRNFDFFREVLQDRDEVLDPSQFQEDNLYTADGTLTGDRTLTNNGFDLGITGTGNVGIGTTAPDSKLDISSGLYNNAGAFKIGADIGGFTRTNSTRKIAVIESPHYSTTEEDILGISFDNNPTTSVINIGGQSGTNHNTATEINLRTSNSNANTTPENVLSLRSNGRVGIGTISPTTDLHIMGNGSVKAESAANPYFLADYTGGAAAKFQALSTFAYIGTETAHNLSFVTNNAAKLTIQNSDGNIGIANTTPTQKLHVTGNARITGAIYDSNNEAGTANQMFTTTGTGTDWIDIPVSTNLYNTDGSLTANRTITSTGQSLEYSALDGNDINVSTFSDNGNTFAITDTGTGALSNLSQRPEYLKLTSAPMQLVNNDDYQLLWTDVETNSTTKNGGIGSFHYTNSEEPFLALVSQSGSSFNSIRFGGGDSGGNAATVIDFYTASNNTTTTGTRRMRINASGNLGLGLVDPTDKLEVDGVVKINDFIKMVPTATVPTSPASGWIYFDDGTNRTGAGPRYYNGSSWVDL